LAVKEMARQFYASMLHLGSPVKDYESNWRRAECLVLFVDIRPFKLRLMDGSVSFETAMDSVLSQLINRSTTFTSSATLSHGDFIYNGADILLLVVRDYDYLKGLHSCCFYII